MVLVSENRLRHTQVITPQSTARAFTRTCTMKRHLRHTARLAASLAVVALAAGCEEEKPVKPRVKRVRPSERPLKRSVI